MVPSVDLGQAFDAASFENRPSSPSALTPASTILGPTPDHADAISQIGGGVGPEGFQHLCAVADFNALDGRMGEDVELERGFAGGALHDVAHHHLAGG